MRWPVSGAAFERAINLAKESQAHAEQVFGELRQRNTDYRDLLEKYHALKLQGAAQPEPKATLDRPEFDPVQAAITAKAGPDRKLRALMGREAAEARRLGQSDAEIIRQIEQGVEIDDGIPA